MTKGNGWTPRTLYRRWYKRGQHQVKKLIASMPSWLEDRGAVAVEFALLLPAQVAMFAGVFGVGAAIIEKMELTYVVQDAAQLEAANPGQGLSSASTQLPPPASFVANPTAPCGTQIVGWWPITLGVLPSLTLSAQACWQLPKPPP